MEIFDVLVAGTEPASHNRFILPRYHFDHALVKLALEHGAEWITGLVVGLHRERETNTGVVVRRGQRVETIHGRVVIGCYGSSSTIARLFHPQQQASLVRAMAIRAYI